MAGVILRWWGMTYKGSHGLRGHLTTGVKGQIWPDWSSYTQSCLESPETVGMGSHDLKSQRSTLALMVALLCHLTTGIRGQIWPNWSNYTQSVSILRQWGGVTWPYGSKVKWRPEVKTGLNVHIFPKNQDSMLDNAWFLTHKPRGTEI